MWRAVGFLLVFGPAFAAQAQGFDRDAIGVLWPLGTNVVVGADPLNDARVTTGFGGVTETGRLDPDGAVARIGARAVLARDVGQVAGWAQDDATPPNTYLAASSDHGLFLVGPDRDGDFRADLLARGEPAARWMAGQWGNHVDAGPGSIWRVDGATGEITLFAVIRNPEGAKRIAGLGALVFDPVAQQLLVSDPEHGVITALDLQGRVLGRWDHGASLDPTVPPLAQIPPHHREPRFAPHRPDSWGTTRPERRVGAMARRAGRLWYDTMNGQAVWSVALSPEGGFAQESGPRAETGNVGGAVEACDGPCLAHLDRPARPSGPPLILRCQTVDHTLCRAEMSGPGQMTLVPVVGHMRHVSVTTSDNWRCETDQNALICQGQGAGWVTQTLAHHGPVVTCARLDSGAEACTSIDTRADLQIIQRADWGRGGTCHADLPCVFTYELINRGPDSYVGPVTLRARMRLDHLPALGRYTDMAPAVCDPADLMRAHGCTFQSRLAPGARRLFTAVYTPQAHAQGYLQSCIRMWDISMQVGDDPDGMDWQSSCADLAIGPTPAISPNDVTPPRLTLTDQGCDAGQCRIGIDAPGNDAPVPVVIRFDKPVPGAERGAGHGAVRAEGMACLRGDSLGLGCVLSDILSDGAGQLILRQAAIIGDFQVCVRAGWSGFTIQRAQLVQQLLNMAGYEAGPVDGMPGSKTRKAIAALRADRDLDKNTSIQAALDAFGIAQSDHETCVTLTVPPLPALCLPWEKRDETGACRSPGPICAPGQRRNAMGYCQLPNLRCGIGLVPEGATCADPPLRCDHITTRWQDGVCQCRFPGMIRASAARCGCPKGRALAPGAGCLPLHIPADRNPLP